MTLICYKPEITIKGARLDRVDQANSIITSFREDGFTLSLRQLYYQFVALALIENSDRSYKNLGTLISDARDAGLIPWDAIEDRGRGIRPWLIEEDELSVVDGIEHQFALDFWQRQNVYVEVWIEKDALSDVVKRPCQRWRVPFMPCKGYLSASEAWRAGQRFKEAHEEGRECVLIHLGDHDPSGTDMTRDNAARVELYSDGAEVDVRRIALNMDQVERYNPPPNPLKVKGGKLSDSRALAYLERFGRESWELDALNPSILDRLVDDEIRTLVDVELWDETRAEELDRRVPLAAIHAHYDEIGEFVRGLEQ